MFSKIVHNSILSLIVVTANAVADTPTPGAHEQMRLDVIVEAAVNDKSLAPVVFDVLRLTAEGAAPNISEEMEVALGMAPSDLRGANAGLLRVRGHAYVLLGKLATPAAVAYLEGIHAEDFSQADVHGLWPSVRIGLREAQLRGAPGRREEARLLEQMVRDSDEDAIARSEVTDWAIERLCESGALEALPVVRESILASRPGLEGQVRAQFCEARMTVVSISPDDRIAALASVLQVTERPVNKPLVNWAINELTAMNSPRAEELMERYEREIRALPDNSARKRELLPLAEAIYYRDGMRAPGRPIP